MQPRERDIVQVLRHRVRLAVAEAERAIARSQALVAARRLMADREELARRCAWCGRVCLADEWTPADELPHFLSHTKLADASHGICPDCLERLERERDDRRS